MKKNVVCDARFLPKKRMSSPETTQPITTQQHPFGI
jgi:hypothetical protein